MKAKHIPAGFAEKPCLRHLTSKTLQTKANPQGRTGFRCTKAEGHRRTDKDPFGHICAAIGTGTVFASRVLELRNLSPGEASDLMGTLNDKGGFVHKSQMLKRSA